MSGRTSTLIAAIVAADGLLFGAGIPLERYSLLAAADKASSAMTIALLLLANFMLLAVAFIAFAASSCLIERFVKQILHARLRRRLR